MSTVAVVGLGYVGLPLAVRAAKVGHHVIGIDLDERKISSLAEATSYVEDVTDAELKEVIEAGRFRAEHGHVFNGPVTDDLACFDIAIIAVPTPLRGTEPDLTYVESAARMLGQMLCKGSTVVLESTTYPGTTEGLLASTLANESGLTPGVDFHLGFSPERIDPGSKVYTLQNTPKLVSATTAEGLEVIQGFYDTIVDTTVPVDSPAIAETAKLFENIQANVMIALSNEMATLCRGLEIDFWKVLDAAMTKGHSVSRWTPGPGVGGHCLPIDPMYLAWLTRNKIGQPFKFAELADEVNKGRTHYVAERAAELVDLQGAEVLVLGVAYKPNVGDLRESPALDIVTELRNRGALVTVTDPHVENWDITPVLPHDDLFGQISRFPLVVLVTNHAAYDYDKIGDSAQVVLDCRNAMRPNSNVVAL